MKGNCKRSAHTLTQIEKGGLFGEICGYRKEIKFLCINYLSVMCYCRNKLELGVSGVILENVPYFNWIAVIVHILRDDETRRCKRMARDIYIEKVVIIERK